ncbi:MAG: hypothetical protein V7K85_05055 [Nostoc sp.]
MPFQRNLDFGEAARSSPFGRGYANAERLVEKGVSPMSDCTKPKGLKEKSKI